MNKKILIGSIIVICILIGVSFSSAVNLSIERGNEPPYPPYIDGPTYGELGVEYEYTFVSDDPEADYIWYYIEWGDGNNTGWIGHYESGEEINRSHYWPVNRTYEIRAKAKDFWNESRWSVLLVIIGNHPPSAPKINGPVAIRPKVEYEYSFVSKDPDNDNISYLIDWGDGHFVQTEYYPSGVEIILNHTYYKKGTFVICAKAKDIHGAESNLSEWYPQWEYEGEVITLICGGIDSFEIHNRKGAIRDIEVVGDNISIKGLRIIQPYGWKDWYQEQVAHIVAPRYLGYLRSNYMIGIAIGDIGWW